MNTRALFPVFSLPSCFLSGETGESGEVALYAPPLLGFCFPTFSESGEKQWGTSPELGDFRAFLSVFVHPRPLSCGEFSGFFVCFGRFGRADLTAAPLPGWRNLLN